MTATISEVHARQLAAIEGMRLCDVKTAARYLGRTPQHVYDLLRKQELHSGWDGGRRMVVVKDLIRYADRVENAIDRPEAVR